MPWTEELGVKLEEHTHLRAAFMSYAKDNSPSQAPSGVLILAKIIMMDGMFHTNWPKMSELIAHALLDLTFKDLDAQGVKKFIVEIEQTFGPMTAAKRRLQENQLYSIMHQKLIAKNPKNALEIANIIVDNWELIFKFEQWISDVLLQEIEAETHNHDGGDMTLILEQAGLLSYASPKLDKIHGETVLLNLIQALRMLTQQKLLDQPVTALLIMDPLRTLEVAKTLCELARKKVPIDLVTPLFQRYLEHPPRFKPSRHKPFTDLIDACESLAKENILHADSIAELEIGLSIGDPLREVAKGIIQSKPNEASLVAPLTKLRTASHSPGSAGLFGHRMGALPKELSDELDVEFSIQKVC
jgi:hypothetical protein